MRMRTVMLLVSPLAAVLAALFMVGIASAPAQSSTTHVVGRA